MVVFRWLTHLVLTGKLSTCAGIVLGKFRDCGPSDFKPSFNGTWSWQEVAADRHKLLVEISRHL